MIFTFLPLLIGSDGVAPRNPGDDFL